MELFSEGLTAAQVVALNDAHGVLTLDTPGGYTKHMKQEIKKRVTRRLKIIEGQVRGLQNMVEKEKYCIDVINQSLAIKEALSGVEDLMLENHLSTHVIEQAKAGQKAKAIKEILSVYKLSKKK
jgi:CsoR family transcriptional regulator, copper-sensing transcriptional repressor